ncbi:DegT/DnrJ/EryC1/StrS family aminotransferase [Motilibacter deserti]|uniref:DegT/DnrJ/EryC1/StrS aminotransferase n=1 Tax=Motilibacter deserti TaxID=2714956 RepID=A0ABX0GUM6_9ACTN|nr:DegT/DnrJ/EryC1/StrS family aminotransferase [Motilibacter deserti]NHC14608.1 DegT/DnrJ/EryC1/StrS aminotransferase [Motilibacter deserti]
MTSTETPSASPVPLAEPLFGARERELLLEAMDSGFVSSAGPHIARFERAFAEAVGARHAVACSSGTAALHVALRLCGVGPGDLVAVSDFTFIASANAAAYQGARLLLVDSDRDTWCMDPALLAVTLDARARAGEPLPAAVEAVHVLGQPADLAGIAEACARHGIALVEDAAESLGAGWSGGPLAGRATGTVGRLGAYSFNGNKIITTGGGGMIVTDDEATAERARHLTTQARVPDRGYLHDEVGYNYRLTNLAAALGLAQLERLDQVVARKRAIAARYDAALANTGATLPPRRPGMDSTYWLYSLLVPEGTPADEEAARDALLDALAAARIGARALWRPLHQQPALAGSEYVGGGVGESLYRRGVSLPCSGGLPDEQQERVIEVVLEHAAQRWG